MSQSAQQARVMSVEEWAELDEDEEGELVDGQLEEEELPSTLHAAVVAWLVCVLGGWAVPRGGLVLASEHKLALSARRGRKADVVVYAPGSKLPAKRSSLSRTPPTIVVEVLSARPRDARRDRVDKKIDYAAFGVRWYWIIDPEMRTVEVMRLGDDGRYVDALSASDGAHDVPGCDGLRIDLDALWAELDRLPDEDEPADE